MFVLLFTNLQPKCTCGGTLSIGPCKSQRQLQQECHHDCTATSNPLSLIPFNRLSCSVMRLPHYIYTFNFSADFALLHQIGNRNVGECTVLSPAYPSIFRVGSRLSLFLALPQTMTETTPKLHKGRETSAFRFANCL